MKMRRTDTRTRNIARRVVSSEFIYLFIDYFSVLDGGFAYGSALHVSLLLRGNLSLLGRWFSFFCHPRPLLSDLASVDYIISLLLHLRFFFILLFMNGWGLYIIPLVCLYFFLRPQHAVPSRKQTYRYCNADNALFV